MIAIWYEYLIQGWDVPKIACYTNSASGQTMNKIYDELYNNLELIAEYPRLNELWFKWTDNSDIYDPYSFYTTGDSAPYGRLNYTFAE